MTLFDFGPESIARDPMLVGNQLVAIVGGNVTAATPATSGVPLQVDGGGNIVLVNLGSGAVQHDRRRRVHASIRRPVLSANGRVLIAEGSGNLFRFDLQ